jgi:hypothetical protein
MSEALARLVKGGSSAVLLLQVAEGVGEWPEGGGKVAAALGLAPVEVLVAG